MLARPGFAKIFGGGLPVWIFKGEVFGKRDLSPNVGVTSQSAAGENQGQGGDRRERGDRGDRGGDRRRGGRDNRGEGGGRGGDRRNKKR